MSESFEYVEKLKKFADAVGGSFQYNNKGTTFLKRFSYNRVVIKIPYLNNTIYFTAYSDSNSAETFSGFFASTKLPLSTKCKISRKDPLDKLFQIFGTKSVKTNQPGFDKMFTVKTSNIATVLRLIGKKSILKFVELNLLPPLQFEITDNELGLIKQLSNNTNLITLKSNEWIVDQKQLITLLDGFKLIVDELN